MNDYTFDYIDFLNFVGSGFDMEDETIESWEPRLRADLLRVGGILNRYIDCRGSRWDGLGVDLGVQAQIKKIDFTFKIDFTKNRGYKAVSVWNGKKHFVQAGSVETTVILDCRLLHRYQQREIDVVHLLAYGHDVWKKIEGFCKTDDREGLVAYARKHGCDNIGVNS